ncbi:hypothetical protein [Endozoicomonas sp. SCSIO W0465]|uniref:hypothetical protein n=1 Tax=Endozoicomonas sp. SCSIO W0465 TaxID=2918516 RepID=UPI0020757FA5|nr:hypothetical protein [Endozoicomonas sp. SCSIO W0465]USE35246.1 hypothetical protein MJO57_24575 [Endozoicomonas sp. SCSIO W0465]
MNDFVDIFENHLIEFKINDKEAGEGSAAVYRVLWRDSDKLIWVNVINNSFPEQVDVAYVKQKIDSGEYCFILG